MKEISGYTDVSTMAGILHCGMDLLLSPLVFTTNLILLLRSEVVLDVKCLADLFGGLALDHIRNSLASDVQKSLYIQVVGSLDRCKVSLTSLYNMLKTPYQNNLKEHLLIYLHKLLIPLINVCSLLSRIGIIIICCLRIGLVVFTPLKNLVQHGFIDLAYMSEHWATARGR